MARGDILARLKLDKKAYSAALKEALAESKAFSASLGADTKLALPGVPKLKGVSENTAELAKQREEVRQSLTALKDFNIALREGDLSQEGFIQAARGVQTQLEKDRAQVDLSSKAYGVYTNAINQVSGKVAQVSAAQATSVATQDRAAKAADKTAQAQVRLAQALRVDQVRQYRDELARLNGVYEKDRDRVKYVRDVSALTREMTEFRATLTPATREIGGLDRALGQATRNLNTVQGKISGLGISQQVAIGLNNQFAQSLASSGSLGQVGALGISAYGGAMTGAGLGAVALGAGVLGVGVGTAALVQRGIPQVKAYQQAINILASSGEKDLGRFRGELTNLQEEGGRAAKAFSRAQLAGALAETVKAGVDATDALTLLKTGTQLASAEQEDLAGSTALVLKNVRQFNLDVSEAGRVGDALAQSGLLAADSARDLSEGLATVGPVAAAAGLTIEETLGLLTNLSNKGLDAAQEGATGLRSVLSQLATPSKPAQEAINGLGVSLVNLDGSSKGVKQRLFEVRDAIAASGQDLTKFAAIADTRALTALLALDTSTDDYTQKILKANGALAKFADQQANGLTPAQNRAKAAMDDLSETAAEFFAPAITAGANAVAGLVRNVDNFLGKAGSFESKLKIAFGAEQIKVLEDELGGVRTQIELLETKGERLSKAPKFLGLSIFGSPEEIRAELAENEAVIKEYEAQAADLQARIDKASEPQPKAKKKPKPDARNIIPEVSAEFDKGLADYIKALQDAEDSAAAAQVGAMENGAAKVQAQRQLDLEQAQRAFDAQVAGLKEGSERYNGFLAAFNTETQAINTRANRDLEADAEAKLKTAQTLRERIERVSNDLSNAQARGIDNPIKAIAGQFRVTSQAIKKETDDLLTGVASALQEGAVSAEEAQALVLQINADARGREVQAERTKNAEIRKVQTERKAEAVKLAEETQKAVAEVLGQQAKALSDAQIASLDGAIPQLQATFKAEQEERARNFEATLEGFKGSNSERIGLVKSYNSTEALLSRQHQVQLNAQERTALESYLTTLRDFEQQVAQARQKARQDEIANAQALNTARAASAQGQIDAGDTSGYTALIAVQQDAVRIAKELTQATRERGATASEVISALSAEAEAQRGVVGAVQGQIDALKTLRDKQLEVVNSGSQVLEYARAAAELSGTDFNENDAGAAIRAQVEAQAALFRAQAEANKPLAERLETLKLIQQSEKELADLGQQSGLTSEDRQLISENAAQDLAAYPEQAATALEQIGSLDASIAALGVTLQGATGELQTLLDAAGSDEGLNVAVKVQIDRGALDAAEQTLRETFGAAAGNRIVEASTNAGTRAGAGLIGAFTSGITRNRSALLAEVDRLLAEVRNRLPSSDAKTGPLSDLTYSGGKLTSTFAAGMLKQRPTLASAANMLAATAKPAFAVPSIPTSRALSYPGALPGSAGGSPITVNVDGRPHQSAAPFAFNARALVGEVARELKVKGLS